MRAHAWMTLLLAACLGLPSRPAQASPSYSEIVQEHAGLSCEPACTLCHTRESGGFASANSKVGITLRRMFGAACCEDAALVRILDELAAASVDSDGDGVPDMAELMQASDPNDADPTATLPCRAPAQDGGCSSLGPQAVSPPWSVGVLALGFGALALLRVRRRASRHGKRAS